MHTATMKTMKIALVVLGILIATTAFAQHVDAGYTVGRWQGFCSAAVTYTFDDNCANQFTVAIPMFNEYGFKMTLYPVNDWAGAYWTQLQTAATQGHEIGSHTLSHPHLGTLDSAHQVTELMNSRNDVNTRITAQRCLTIAYPYCETGNINISEQLYIAARICSGQIEPATPANFLAISSIICGDQGSIKTAQDFNARVDLAAVSGGWNVYLIHGIDGDGGYSNLVSANLRGSLAYLDTNRTKFWVSTFATVARYIRERNSLSVSQTSASDSVVTCTVSDALADSIYNVPVTLRRELPAGWLSAIVSQNGNALQSSLVDFRGKKYVMFDAVPDAGEVRISKSDVTGINMNNKPASPKPTLMQNYPNPVSASGTSASGIPGTMLSFSLPSRSQVSLKVFDALGREVSTLISGELSAGTYKKQVNTGGLPSGVYFYRLVAGSVNETRSFVLVR